MESASFLVAEDEPLVARVLAKALAKHGRVDVVATVAAARDILEKSEFSALVVDVGLPDGSGMAIVAFARERDPSIQALLISGRVDATRLADAHALNVQYLLKPVEPHQLALFAQRVRARVGLRPSRTEALIAHWTGLHRLTPSEAELLRLAALGKGRQQLAEARHVAPSTIKKQVQNLLDKIGAPSMDVAVARLLRAAVDGN